MKRYRLSAEANKDLDEILDYLLRHSPENAEKVFNAIHDAAAKVAAMPGMGHHRPDVFTRPVKVWSVYSWLIIYEPISRPLTILRIVHGARDLQSLFKE